MFMFVCCVLMSVFVFDFCHSNVWVSESVDMSVGVSSFSLWIEGKAQWQWQWQYGCVGAQNMDMNCGCECVGSMSVYACVGTLLMFAWNKHVFIVFDQGEDGLRDRAASAVCARTAASTGLPGPRLC